METYRIAVLGAGKVGGTLGKKWLAAGHEVTFGVRDPGSSRHQSLQTESGTPLVVRTLDQALENAEVVLFAISGASMEETIVRHAAQLDGKILIDAANNISSSDMNNVNSLRFFALTPLMLRSIAPLTPMVGRTLPIHSTREFRAISFIAAPRVRRRRW